MKLKHKLLVSAISGLLVAPAAMAEEDVLKVYGQVNISIDNTSLSGSGLTADQKSGSSPWVGRDEGTGMKSNASRFGLRGSLGTNLPDTKLTYVAEMEYTTVGENESDNVYGREATVGLNSKQFGHLRMGRLTPMYKSNYARMDPWTDHVLQGRAGGQQGASNLNANYFNNAIEYRSARMNGFQVGAFYSMMHDKSTDRMHNAGMLRRYLGGSAYGLGVNFSQNKLKVALDTITLDADTDDSATFGIDGQPKNGTAIKATVEYKVTPQLNLGAHYEDVSDLHLGTNIFAVAAYRMGHSLFTASYGLNQGDKKKNAYGEKDATTMNLGYKYKLNQRSDIIAGYSIHERDTNTGQGRTANTFTIGIDAKFGY